MRKLLPCVIALTLLSCQQTPYPGDPEYREFATSDLKLLRMGTRSAASAEIHCRIDKGGECETRRYTLTSEELAQLKDILSRTMPAPQATDEALSRRWKAAGLEIRLLTINGRTLCSVSRNTICSYSDSERFGNTLLCLPDADIGVLNSLPTLKEAQAYKKREDEYANHCRLRQETAENIRKAADGATAARVRLETDSDLQYLELEAEEWQQLKEILAGVKALPAMQRTVWDTSEGHLMPLPPLMVRQSLELLNADGQVLTTLTLDHNILAPESTREAFTCSEGKGEVATLPDEQYSAFQAMSFRGRAEEKERDMREAQLREWQ